LGFVAVVLAGGYAKRLWPLTRDKPKPLLPVAGKPILAYILEKVLRVGVNRIILSTNLRFRSDFEGWLNRSGFVRVEVVADRSRREEEKPGAVKALAEITKNIKDDCLILAGDNIFTSGLEDMVKVFSRVYAPLIAVYDVGDFELAKRYSTVTLDSEGRIVEFVEKPEKPKTTLIGTCIYILPAKTLPRIGEYIDKGLGRDEPGRFIQWLCKQETVYGYRLEGEWWDIGNIETYRDADKYFSKLLSKG